MLRTYALAASVALLATTGMAAPITYDATLASGVPVTGTISDSNTFADPVGAQYYRFFANAGDTVTVTGARLDTNYDMAFWVFQGLFTDTGAFGEEFSFEDPRLVAFGDDEIPHPGPFGDPQSIFTAGTTGFHTVAVTNFLGDPSENGFFDFQLVANIAAPAAITYAATLADGIPVTGRISDSNTFADPVGAQYYRFFANAGDTVTVTGSRLDANYDMAFWVFQGLFTDTGAFGEEFDFSDPHLIAFADDEIPRPGSFGDPQSIFTASATGFHTVAVTNFLSGPSEDGFFDFQLVANRIWHVPEPGSLTLAGLGLFGLARVRRHRGR